MRGSFTRSSAQEEEEGEKEVRVPGGGGADGEPGVLIEDVEDAQQNHEHSGEYFINVQIEHGELEDRSDISLALELIQVDHVATGV